MDEQLLTIRENRTFKASGKRLTAQKQNHRFYREKKTNNRCKLTTKMNEAVLLFYHIFFLFHFLKSKRFFFLRGAQNEFELFVIVWRRINGKWFTSFFFFLFFLWIIYRFCRCFHRFTTCFFFFCSFSIRFLEQREKTQPEVITTFHNIKSFNELLPLSLFQQHDRVILAHINVPVVWIVNTISNSIVLRFTYGLCYIITTLKYRPNHFLLSSSQWWIGRIVSYDSFGRRMAEVKKNRKLFFPKRKKKEI